MRDEEAGGGGREENLFERTSPKNMCFLIKLYFRPRPLPEVLTITNLRRTRTKSKPVRNSDFSSIKLCNSDNHEIQLTVTTRGSWQTCMYDETFVRTVLLPSFLKNSLKFINIFRTFFSVYIVQSFFNIRFCLKFSEPLRKDSFKKLFRKFPRRHSENPMSVLRDFYCCTFALLLKKGEKLLLQFPS